MLDLRWTIGILLAIALAGGCRVKEGRQPSCPDGTCATVAADLASRRREPPGQSDAHPEADASGSPEYRLSPATLCLSELPVVNLPLHARCRNYGGGSCVIASTVSLLRWQGRDDLAEFFRRASSLHAKLEANRVRYAYTIAGDAAFLEWACRTRRGAGVVFFANHFVCLVHLDGQRAMLLDNNRTGEYLTLPRDEFLRRWRGYGGWATTPVYSPAAPSAWR